MTTLERDPQQEELQQAMAKRAEEERLAAHERQYQVGRGAGGLGAGGWGLGAGGRRTGGWGLGTGV